MENEAGSGQDSIGQGLIAGSDVDPQADAAPEKEAVFGDLLSDPTVLEELRAAGFVRPTPVQIKAVPTILADKDSIVQAKTGSGKTLAFLLPYLARMDQQQRPEPRSEKPAGRTGRGRDQRKFYPVSLILTPTRELANQIVHVFSQVTSRIVPSCVIGGVDVRQQLDQLGKDSRVVVGTPGRVLDLLRSRTISLAECRYFVLDEADEMLSMGFLEDVRAILSRLPDQRQGVFVSATITPRVDMLANSFLTKPEIVFVDSPYEDLPPIQHMFTEVAGELMAKPSMLCDLIEIYRPASAIIFCNTKSDTHLVEVLLRRRGFDARRINSDLSQRQRDRIIKRIRDRDLQFLIATDIAARGLDIEQIDLVVNYSIPEQSELYIHRTGRTGRAGKSGRAISLVSPRDFGSFHHLTKVVDVKFEKLTPPREDEVADARLVHLYEALRTSSVELRERDLLVAQKLLQEVGEVSEPNEDLQLAVAKMAKFMFEHLIRTEEQSLDEELGGEEGGEDRRRDRDRDRDRRDRRGDERRGDDRRGDDRRSDDRQGEDRRGDDRRREDRRGDNRRGDDRNGDDRRRESRGEGRREENRGGDNRSRGDDDRRSHDSRESGAREAQYRGLPQREVRVFVGQGTSQGMTDKLIVELSKEFADIEPEALRLVNIREEYGFVDLFEADALRLIETLHGIEINGAELNVEFAAIVSDDRERNEGRDRGEGRSRSYDDRGRGGYRDRDRGRRRGGGRRDRR